MEDSRPQAILKFHRLSSLDYRVRHELPVMYNILLGYKYLKRIGLYQVYSFPENIK